MGHHLTERVDFKSDKYDWCPVGFFALKFSDPLARQVIRRYAFRTDDDDLAADLIAVCDKYDSKSEVS